MIDDQKESEQDDFRDSVFVQSKETGDDSDDVLFVGHSASDVMPVPIKRDSDSEGDIAPISPPRKSKRPPLIPEPVAVASVFESRSAQKARQRSPPISPDRGGVKSVSPVMPLVSPVSPAEWESGDIRPGSPSPEIRPSSNPATTSRPDIQPGSPGDIPLPDADQDQQVRIENRPMTGIPRRRPILRDNPPDLGNPPDRRIMSVLPVSLLLPPFAEPRLPEHPFRACHGLFGASVMYHFPRLRVHVFEARNIEDFMANGTGEMDFF